MSHFYFLWFLLKFERCDYTRVLSYILFSMPLETTISEQCVITQNIHWLECQVRWQLVPRLRVCATERRVHNTKVTVETGISKRIRIPFQWEALLYITLLHIFVLFCMG
jgi:hypothetical protein